MNKDDGVYVDGQGVQVPPAPVSLVGANDEMQKISIKRVVIIVRLSCWEFDIVVSF
jgi:hypothetical protein